MDNETDIIDDELQELGAPADAEVESFDESASDEAADEDTLAADDEDADIEEEGADSDR